MRITFDESACVGHGRCYALAPEVFGADDQGHCVLLDAAVPAGLDEKVRQAVENCPEEALGLEG